MKCIFIMTVQHTGTWWLINTLRSHPQVGAFAHIRNLVPLYNNWPIREDGTNPMDEKLLQKDEQDKIQLIHQHGWFNDRTEWEWRAATVEETLATIIPTISPLRDPLLGLLTVYRREPWRYPLNHYLDGWIHAGRRYDKLPIHFFSLVPFREDQFRDALQAVGLDLDEQWLSTIEPDKKQNSSLGDSDPLLDAYHAGNRDIIERALPAPFRALMELEPLLRPFLEKYGYSNLLWWS